MEILDDVVLTLRGLHQPVIAAVNGPAIGGGLCLALACDIRIAADGAFFRAAGINNGLTASELGLSYLLPRAIGSSRAFEIMLTGRDVDAEEAERIGLVSRVRRRRGAGGRRCRDRHPDRGLEPPRRRADQAHAVVRPRRRQPAQHMNAEGLGQLYVRLLTDNFDEAVAARHEGRDPVFRD